MDVDKKLGMSLDDLIKKTRSERPKKPATGQKKGKFEKKGKLGVRKSLGKRMEDDKPKTRSAGKKTAVATVSKGARRIRRVSTDNRRERSSKMDTSDDTEKHSRKVVVRKGPNAPADPRRKIKITNVPYDLTWKDVKSAVSEVGKIERCDVEHGEALITFASHKEAARAIQTYDNGDMNGRKIRVFFV